MKEFIYVVNFSFWVKRENKVKSVLAETAKEAHSLVWGSLTDCEQNDVEDLEQLDFREYPGNLPGLDERPLWWQSNRIRNLADVTSGFVDRDFFENTEETPAWSVDRLSGDIKRVAVVRKSEKFVWLHNPKGLPIKVSPDHRHKKLFYSWEYARQFSVEVNTKAMSAARRMLADAQKRIDELPHTAEQHLEIQRREEGAS